MYNGKYASSPAPKKRRGSKRIGTLTASLLLLLTFAIGGTVAYLVTDSILVTNTFTPGNVTCEVHEEFDGTTKENVQVKNTGNVDAYIRVKLVSYRMNEDGQLIGGSSPVDYMPAASSGWVYNPADGHYYYTSAVPADGFTGLLIGSNGDGLTLKNEDLTFYDGNAGENAYMVKDGDYDGGYQVIEVMAEAIQADGVDKDGNHPVTLAWGIDVDENGNLIIADVPSVQ